jgi:hypothetical protein
MSDVIFTSLKERETPGNLDDCIFVTPSGLGGNDAASVVSAREHTAHEIFNIDIVAN